jgi:hypothetical protein
MRKMMLVVVTALVAASAATAAPPPGKGKPTSGAGCKPAVAVMLTGTLASGGTSTLPFALSVKVTGGNSYGQAYKKVTQPITVQVTGTTAINRQGDHHAADLKTGDRVTVQARACKADLAATTPPQLTAARVTAHPSR